MAKDLNPKCKRCRRAGEKLFLKGERCNSQKCAIVKRNYPPGVHGSTRRARLTDYGTQLQEKQKAKRQYNLMEKQFRLTFDKAGKKSGNTGENFLKLLETRFDNIVYRLGFATSRPQARQIISHGLLTINGQRVDIPSYIVRQGDEITIKANKKNLKLFKELTDRLKNKEVPGWLNLDKNKIVAKVLHQPDMKDINPNFNVQVIVEYYSR
ncbi:30S ribosomal protein S4 [Candidatus Parcubacteria bacterium]|nr:MAG: 30S ribosomal protein S4 [Candidatus Parcubacteria bacterium]